MKHVLTILILTICITVVACFFSDPHDTLPTRTILTSRDVVQVELPNTNRPDNWSGWTKPSGWANTETNMINANCYISFPFTLQVEILGFQDGSVPIRICLLMYSKHGKWTILKDIRPSRDITSNTGLKTALFGKYIISKDYGYKSGDIIPIIIYVKSNTQETHNMQQLMDGTLKWDTEGVLYLGVINNIIPR